MIISVLSQKGGVGKSSISRTLAVEFTRAGWKTLLADIDSSQITSNRWAEKRRNANDIDPPVETAVYSVAAQAITQAKSSDYDLVIIDGAPHATRGTAEAAMASDLVIIPTSTSMDDLEPSVLLANELAKSLNSEKIVFVLYKTTSEAQEREARETLNSYGYEVLNGSVPVRTGYIDAFDRGFCATETRYKKLNEMAEAMVKSVVNKVKEDK
ncbi:MAG: chromosome partitioning protein [Oleiphilaceae bacterium]